MYTVLTKCNDRKISALNISRQLPVVYMKQELKCSLYCTRARYLMLALERPTNLDVNSGRAMLDTCHETWILGTISAFVGTEEKDRKTSSCTVQNL